MCGCFFLTSSASWRVCLREDRSAWKASTLSLPVADLISFAAVSAFSALLQDTQTSMSSCPPGPKSCHSCSSSIFAKRRSQKRPHLPCTRTREPSLASFSAVCFPILHTSPQLQLSNEASCSILRTLAARWIPVCAASDKVDLFFGTCSRVPAAQRLYHSQQASSISC